MTPTAETAEPTLTIGAANDVYEQQADAVANQIMRMPEQPFVQRKCAHCEEEESLQRKPLASFIQRKADAGGGMASQTVTNQIQATKGGGTPLPTTTRSFMETRFGTDFSQVNIHTGSDAVQLSRELNAQAFTVGNDIYFNSGKFSPDSTGGRQLLAHELTHTVQQSHGCTNNPILNDKLSGSTYPHIARFSDTGHHIIEEAGLAGGGFTESQMRQIELGNIKRDYSQTPSILNFALLCKPDTFGGYHAADHFDNYIWNNDKQVFEDRGKLEAKQFGAGDVYKGTDPIVQIEENLNVLMNLGPTRGGLEHLGNAFHAIEDFFAHSNFINLTMNDYRFGHDLITGSNDPGASQIATANSLNAVSVPGLPVTPPDHVDKIKQAAPALSHSKIAKDYPSDPLHYEARQLAALVVQDLSRDIVEILKTPESDKRKQLCKEIVFTKIRRYLHPPDAAKDPWWTKLIAADKGAIDILLKKAEQATPVTINQCILSPLVNLEATRTSPVRAFGMFNPVIGLGRVALGLTPLMGGLNWKDIALGSVPSVSVPFTVNGKRASITLGGMLLPPFGAVNSLIPNERMFWPDGVIDHGRDKYGKTQSMTGGSLTLEF